MLLEQDPPPGVEGSACLYALEVDRAVEGGGHSRWFYVGETESVRKRLAQHRKKVRRPYVFKRLGLVDLT